MYRGRYYKMLSIYALMGPGVGERKSEYMSSISHEAFSILVWISYFNLCFFVNFSTEMNEMLRTSGQSMTMHVYLKSILSRLIELMKWRVQWSIPDASDKVHKYYTWSLIGH